MTLGVMARDDARRSFVTEVQRLMPHLDPYLEAHDKSSQEEEDKSSQKRNTKEQEMMLVQEQKG
jgi:hypothetical protein